MYRGFVLMVVATLALGGCAKETKETATPNPIRPKDLVAFEGPAPVGRIFVKAGDNDLDADLYQAEFATHTFERLTTKARVSTVDGCPQRVVVAAAQQSVGFTDHLQELQDGKLSPVETLGLEPGSDPHLSDDCRILSTRLAPGGGGAKEVRLWDPTKATSTTVAADPAIVSAAWGPEGQILIFRRDASGPKLLIRQPDGKQSEIEPQAPDMGNVQWGRSGWIAMGLRQPQQPPTATLFLNPSTNARSTLDGWLPLAWSPDGQQLLVADASKGTTLAVVETPNLTKTRNVGFSEVGTVWDAVWLPPA